jgi:hypothetical protein
MLALASFGISDELHDYRAEVTRRFAVEEDGLANWPSLADGAIRESRSIWPTASGHGAPPLP